jgi:O-succinylbenzoic acid--CoA ligase
LRTGDLGELDVRGRLVVHARRSDLIVSGGENVYPAEIEAVLQAHPGVVDCAVVPWPDEDLGQVGWAAVVLRDRQDTGDLDRHCRDRLAGFKVPRKFIVVDDLPLTRGNKLDRAALLQRLRAIFA